jgi:hypothetical protein
VSVTATDLEVGARVSVPARVPKGRDHGVHSPLTVLCTAVDIRHTLSYNKEVEETDYDFDPEKNRWLIRERGIGFEEIIALIESSKLLRVLEHPNKAKYPEQLLYEVDVDGYVHVVPVSRIGKTLFMKTIYPSRKATSALKKERETP